MDEEKQRGRLMTHAVLLRVSDVCWHALIDLQTSHSCSGLQPSLTHAHFLLMQLAANHGCRLCRQQIIGFGEGAQKKFENFMQK